MKPRRFLVGILPALLIGVLLLLCPARVMAHGAGYTLEPDAQAVVVKFEYSTGEPMAYAETLVYSPGDSKIEFQNGRTDRQGRFAFRPAKGGVWRIIVSDGQGHRVNAQLEVTADTGAPPLVTPEKTSGPNGGVPWWKALLGVSIITNIVFLAGSYKKKKRLPPC